MRQLTTLDRRRAGIAGATAAMTMAALWSPVPAAGAQSSRTDRVTDLAVRGLGGESALRGLSAFRLRSTGSTFILDEGPRPGSTVSPASTFSLNLTYDLRRAGDRLRADYVRTSVGTPRPVSEVIAGRRGYITGVDANFSQPAVKPMTSDRWAAILREQRLLNPQLYVRQLLSRPERASVLGTRTLNGRPHRVLVVRGDVAPVRLYVDARSGRIHRLTTVDHSDNRGDVRTVVDFRGWRGAGDGVQFPRRVTLSQTGRVLHTETRSVVRANPALDAARFRIPPSVDATFDPALADRGARSAEWLMSFAHLGFIKDGPATAIVPRTVAPGSTLIQGIPNQSMIIEQQDGIVVAEGALSSPRAEALIRYIRATYPGKPIRYVTGSHHHADHSGGMRPFVALGARPVVHTNAVPFFTRVFADRSSRLLRDRLDRSTKPVNILAVPTTGTVTLPDAVRPVTVLAEPTTHATTTILVHVPSEGVLFVNGDTYTPGAPAGPGAASLDQTIKANNLNVSWIVGGHGGVISYADFQAAVAAL